MSHKKKTMKCKIKKFLLRQEGVTLHAEAATGSLYFDVDGIHAIRLSDHLGFDNSKRLHILLPHNSSTQFVVFLNNRPIIIDNYQRLKEFVKNYILTFKLFRSENDDLEAHIEEAVQGEVEKATSGIMAKIDAWVEAKALSAKEGSTMTLDSQEQELVRLYRSLHPSYRQGVINNTEMMSKTSKSRNYQKTITQLV